MAPQSRSAFARPFSALFLALLIAACFPLAAFAGESENREARENPSEREQWFLHGRTYQGKVAPNLLRRAQQQRDTLRFQARQRAQLRRAITAGVTTDTPTWTELGPASMKSAVSGDDQDYGPVTGRATVVVVDQNDTTGNTVYVGGAYGGVWKSQSAANSDLTKVFWKPIVDDQPTISVGAIAVQPGDSNILVVGTGEPNSSADSYYGLGILRSTDAGNSWTLISSANNGLRPFHGLAFSKIAFSTDNPNLLVAATASASEGIRVGAENPVNNAAACAIPTTLATCRGLYYSLDAGVTWNQASLSDGSSATPDNGSASSVVYNAQQHKFYAATRAHGFYVSTDGINFTRLVTQPNSSLSLVNCPTSPTNLNTCPLYRAEITVVPGRDEMYVWYVDASTTPANGGIYQTKDGGNTWTALNVSGITNCGDSLGCDTAQGDYNLALTAIPNGATATDVYAGAVNIFRCQINSNNPTCATNPFINLTHTYGCSPIGSFSKVHPDQHWIDYLQSNANIMFFANDGGVYRTLTALNANNVPSNCPASTPASTLYPFENLNGSMGSMTQFVWFSQHPTDQYTLLGGTQDNGSPAIDPGNSGPNGLTWRSVQGGDGGFNDINPTNANEWFASFPRVQITRCINGSNCTDDQFQTVVNSAKVGGDGGPFYMPYMLDPQNSGQIILGTCRVWRISTAGTNGIALSQQFDGTSAACSQSSPSVVNALAVGGPSVSGVSSVIYAGTDDGRVFSTASAIAASTWVEVSSSGGFSNPNHYPISSIAIDPNDASGNTAYVTVMGFRTSHVWRTTNSGGSWTDISGDIPDSPTNAVVVDRNSGTVYVGSDVGVFSTTSPNGTSTTWTEVGPATGVGALPNVAVTRLAIFAPPGQPSRLRASTYGRGIWEMPLTTSGVPDYSLSISNPDILTYPGQAVSFNGTLTASNGYNNAVSISCDASIGGIAGPLPSTCSPNPGSVNPGSNSIFTINVSNPTVQDFQFRIKGTGSDQNNLVRQAAVQLRVIDFALATPSPASITNLPQGSSTTVQMQVTSLGSFDQQVSITCSGLPPGLTCTAPAVTLASAPVQSTITFAASDTTASGTYTINLVGSWSAAGGITRTHSQPLDVTVTSPVFTVTSTGFSPGMVNLPRSLTATITVTPRNNYAGRVNLSCVGIVLGIGPSACAFNPPSLVVGDTAVTSMLTIVTNGGIAGSGQITVKGTDGTNTNTALLPFTLVSHDFNLNFDSANNATVKAGATATGSLMVSSTGSFSSAVNLTVSGCPSNTTCTVSPTSITPISGTPANATLTVVTKAASISNLRNAAQERFVALWLGMSFGVGILFVRQRRITVGAMVLAAALLIGMVACGGGSGSTGGTTPVPTPGTPAGTYTLVVTGTSGTTVKTANFTLTVQ